MADPTKAETDEVFKVLKAHKGNKVSIPYFTRRLTAHLMHGLDRCVLTAKLGIRHGQVSLLEFTFVWIAQVDTATWVCISVSFGKELDRYV